MAELKLPAVRLLYDRILTTTNTKKSTSPQGIILASKEEGLLLGRQTVVAAGPNAIVEIGDEVEINFFSFPKKLAQKAKNDTGPDLYDINFPIESIDGETYLYFTTQNLKWIYDKDDKDEEII